MTQSSPKRPEVGHWRSSSGNTDSNDNSDHTLADRLAASESLRRPQSSTATSLDFADAVALYRANAPLPFAIHSQRTAASLGDSEAANPVIGISDGAASGASTAGQTYSAGVHTHTQQQQQQNQPFVPPFPPSTSTALQLVSFQGGPQTWPPIAMNSSSHSIAVADDQRPFMSPSSFDTLLADIAPSSSMLATAASMNMASSSTPATSQHTFNSNSDSKSTPPSLSMNECSRSSQSVTSIQTPVSQKCSSCGTSDTPEWRRGQDNQKTLCNACGLRYQRNAASLQSHSSKRGRNIDANSHSRHRSGSDNPGDVRQTDDGARQATAATATAAVSPTRMQKHINNNQSTDTTSASRTLAWAAAASAEEAATSQKRERRPESGTRMLASVSTMDAAGDNFIPYQPKHAKLADAGSDKIDNHHVGVFPAATMSGSAVPKQKQHTDTLPKRRFSCPFDGCDSTFSTSGHAVRHSRLHDSVHPFSCPHGACQATFTRRDNCIQHQGRRHGFQLAFRRAVDDN